MKKLGLFLLTAIATISFTACNKGGSGVMADNQFVTVRALPGSDNYYFEIDNGKKLFPGDKSRVAGYVPKDGQRALLTFSLIETKVEGYDYNVTVYMIQNIYTEIAQIISTQEELDALKDDKVNYLDGMLTGRYLTIIVRYPVTDNTKHKFKLIYNDVTAPDVTEEGYLNVELRHDAGEEAPGYYNNFYLSFNVEELHLLMKDKKGMLIRYNSLQEGVLFEKVDLIKSAE